MGARPMPAVGAWLPIKLHRLRSLRDLGRRRLRSRVLHGLLRGRRHLAEVLLRVLLRTRELLRSSIRRALIRRRSRLSSGHALRMGPSRDHTVPAPAPSAAASPDNCAPWGRFKDFPASLGRSPIWKSTKRRMCRIPL